MKHQLSYQWRLFLPLATILCIVFGLIIYYQYKREADYRAQIFGSELEMIDNRILNAYDEDVNLRTFLNFIRNSSKDQSLKASESASTSTGSSNTLSEHPSPSTTTA